MRILANDGIGPEGKALLEKHQIQVEDQHIPQEQLSETLQNYDGVLVRSATKITKEIIDRNLHLTVIGRGGVGMDNIEVDYAREHDIQVINTPLASTRSVAELTIAFILSGVRNLHRSYQEMPQKGSKDFKGLKKQLSKGIEVQGKTIGLIGFGAIGQEVAKLAIGLGMNVLISTSQVGKQYRLDLELMNIELNFTSISKEQLLQEADIISLHCPNSSSYVLDEKELQSELNGIINTSRGSLINEEALIAQLNSGNIGFAGLDVFQNEPLVNQALLEHPKVLSSPHIGGSTIEAQERVWIQIAEQIIKIKGQHLGK